MDDTPKNGIGKTILIGLLILAVIVAAVCFILIIKRNQEYAGEDQVSEQTRNVVMSYTLDAPSDYPLASRVFKDTDLIDIAGARDEANPELYAYIISEDGTLNYPVMQSEEKDKYIDKDFFGNESEYGCLYVSNESIYEKSRNLVINGHHMRNGKMFGSLEKYLANKDYYKKNSYVKLITDDEIRVYEVCAAVPYSLNDDGTLSKSTYFSPEGFEEFKEEILKNGKVFGDFTYDDITLSLITCAYDREEGRLLVLYKLVDSQPI